MSAPAERRLPCGADVEALLEQVADGTTPDPATTRHQQDCPYCAPVLAELADAWAPLDALDATPPTPRSLDVSVRERVATLATHGWHAVLAERSGATRIGAWVVAVVARRAAAGVPGVHAVTAQVTPDDGRSVAVTLTVTVDAGVPIPAVGAQVRRAVDRHVRLLTGLTATHVGVHVADVV